MKFLENPKLEALSSALSLDSGECRLDLRLESYSCKMVQNDKRLLKELLGPGTSPHDLQPLSPPALRTAPPVFPSPHSPVRAISDPGDSSPILCDSISRKMLFDLVTLLNTSFPDYDFTDAKGENFASFHDLEGVVRSVDTQLSTVIESFAGIRQDLWALLDAEIQLQESYIFSYKPDLVSDPFSEDGCLWSFNYFFYNKRLKRILFFSCRALSSQGVAEDAADEPMWNLDY